MSKRRKSKRKKMKKEKFKESIGKITEDNFLTATIDHKNSKINVYTNDMLIKRMHRESIKIGKSFDKICKVELLEISKLFSECIFVISTGFMSSVDQSDELRITSGKLLMNATRTIQASVELLRLGYILQPGMLLRSIIETVSTISYFLMESEGHQKYLDGNFDVNKTIKYGKQVIPRLGCIQGFLSNNFVHISELHGDFNLVTEYKEITEPLSLNLSLIRSATWLTYVISELVFYDSIDEHKYWQRVEGNGYKFEQTDEVKEWMKHYFGEE